VKDFIYLYNLYNMHVSKSTIYIVIFNLNENFDRRVMLFEFIHLIQYFILYKYFVQLKYYIHYEKYL
jgi:hypothetical protein